MPLTQRDFEDWARLLREKYGIACPVDPHEPDSEEEVE